MKYKKLFNDILKIYNKGEVKPPDLFFYQEVNNHAEVCLNQITIFKIPMWLFPFRGDIFEEKTNMDRVMNQFKDFKPGFLSDEYIRPVGREVYQIVYKVGDNKKRKVPISKHYSDWIEKTDDISISEGSQAVKIVDEKNDVTAIVMGLRVNEEENK